MNFYEEIKNRLIYNEAYKKIKDYSKDTKELETYYEVGKILVEAQGGEEKSKYGNLLIREYSKKLSDELNKKYSITTLKYMRQFFLFINNAYTYDERISISHYKKLMTLKDKSEVDYYINITINENLGKRGLDERIKSKEYDRLSIESKNKINKKEKLNALDMIKNPIYIESNYALEDVKENVLEDMIIEQLPNFLKQLGEGYCFCARQFKCDIHGKNNYIDILLFNYIFNCFTVIELKTSELNKNHFGQLSVYMNYVDTYVKSKTHDKTLGVIIVKEDDGLYAEFYPDDRIKVVRYKINSF